MKNIRDLMSGTLFSVLLGCILYIALILFSLDQSTVLNIGLLVNINALLTYLMIGYTCCHFSESITTNYFEIGKNVYNSLWNEMKIQQQKAIVLMIAQSQVEFRLTGFELVDCSLARFLSVTVKTLLF